MWLQVPMANKTRDYVKSFVLAQEGYPKFKTQQLILKKGEISYMFIKYPLTHFVCSNLIKIVRIFVIMWRCVVLTYKKAQTSLYNWFKLLLFLPFILFNSALYNLFFPRAVNMFATVGGPQQTFTII